MFCLLCTQRNGFPLLENAAWWKGLLLWPVSAQAPQCEYFIDKSSMLFRTSEA